MSNSNFEALVEKEPLIHDLLNNQHVNLFSKYPNLPDDSPEFLEWISPQYFKSFEIIYNECVTNNTEGKLLAFLKTPQYCDSKTYDKIIHVICNDIEQRNLKNEQYSNDLKSKTKTINEIYNENGLRVVNKVDVVIFNALDHPKITNLKSSTLDLALKILQHLRSYNHLTIGMTLYNQTLDNVRKINLTDVEKGKFSNLTEAKPSFELDGKTLLSIGAVILICIRIYLKLQNA